MKRRKVYGVLQMRDGTTIAIQNAQVAEYISSLIEQRDRLLMAVAEEREACILLANEVACPAEGEGHSSCGDLIADLIRERRK